MASQGKVPHLSAWEGAGASCVTGNLELRHFPGSCDSDCSQDPSASPQLPSYLAGRPVLSQATRNYQVPSPKAGPQLCGVCVCARGECMYVCAAWMHVVYVLWDGCMCVIVRVIVCCVCVVCAGACGGAVGGEG